MNEYNLKAAVYTALRAKWPVTKLQVMEHYGTETPVSGDALAQRKADLAKSRS